MKAITHGGPNMNHIIRCVALACLAASTGAWADGKNGPPCRPGEVRGAHVTEHSNRPNVSWDIVLTNGDMKEIPGGPGHVDGRPDGRGGSFAEYDITPAMGACDVINKSVVNQPVPAPGGGGGGGAAGGATSHLWIEAMYWDPLTHSFYLSSVFDELYRLHPNVALSIPDLYADINQDGTIGEGDTLYSLVNIPEYLQAIPTHAFDQVFSIVNGTVAALPGMYFSTTPFVFAPNSTNGLGFTPYTGAGVELTDHVVETPEPQTVSLLLAGLLALGFLRSRSGKRT